MNHSLLTAAAHNQWPGLKIRQRSGHTGPPAHLAYTYTGPDCHTLGPQILNKIKQDSLRAQAHL